MHRTGIRRFRVAIVAALAMAGLAALATAAAAAPPSDVVGQLYVNDNTAGVNTVAGFDRHADGRLTPIPGSPFAVGGAGTGQRVASQGSLQLSADGRYLLAVDAGSNEISVVRIKPDGGCRSRMSYPRTAATRSASPSTTASSTWRTPATTAAELHRLHAQRRRPPPAARRLDGVAARGSQPGDVLFSGDGTKLVGTRVEHAR